ncbi:hypothetical protein GALMADRAFT_782971 [Galerina marginata CBS 339.88]|uniref:DUF6534 domain-containing protein n=1 Tax=Galerina marginata (strain CBS 339.88) TaxID=685588 RepID=A0A067SLT2_GALM3|nr:hypothetical protein GALMADRAFT_782971 [Galerina marginata CBS 339.88]
MGFADTNLVLGPLVISTVLNAFIYGICIMQLSSYWDNGFKDPYIIKMLVGWTVLLDTFHTCALLYMLWIYVVVNFNNPIYLTTILWPFSSTPIITTLTSFPIQIYLAWRIRQFSHSTKVFFYLVILSAAQASLGFTCSIAAFHVPDLAAYHTLIPFVDAWQVLAVAADGSITVLLWWYLSKSRTGQKRSDNVITRLIRSSIETAAFGAFFCIMDLVTFTSLLDTNFHVIFAFPMGRIYTNTLLMTLNSRTSLRAELERPIIPDIVLDQSHHFTPPNSIALSLNSYDPGNMQVSRTQSSHPSTP